MSQQIISEIYRLQSAITQMSNMRTNFNAQIAELNTAKSNLLAIQTHAISEQSLVKRPELDPNYTRGRARSELIDSRSDISISYKKVISDIDDMIRLIEKQISTLNSEVFKCINSINYAKGRVNSYKEDLRKAKV